MDKKRLFRFKAELSRALGYKRIDAVDVTVLPPTVNLVKAEATLHDSLDPPPLTNRVTVLWVMVGGIWKVCQTELTVWPGDTIEINADAGTARVVPKAKP